MILIIATLTMMVTGSSSNLEWRSALQSLDSLGIERDNLISTSNSKSASISEYRALLVPCVQRLRVLYRLQHLVISKPSWYGRNTVDTIEMYEFFNSISEPQTTDPDVEDDVLFDAGEEIIKKSLDGVNDMSSRGVLFMISQLVVMDLEVKEGFMKEIERAEMSVEAAEKRIEAIDKETIPAMANAILGVRQRIRELKNIKSSSSFQERNDLLIVERRISELLYSGKIPKLTRSRSFSPKTIPIVSTTS
jgi:hypothetical protein